jgi:molybdate transport system substrate-binding protein
MALSGKHLTRLPALRQVLWLWALVACLASAPASAAPLTVFAASSLREVFGQLGRQFAAVHPGVAVQFQFAGSQELRVQLEHGARADVYAAADEAQVAALARVRPLSPVVVFARNELVLAVAAPAARRIRTLADLPKAERIVLATPASPIGRYTLQMLELAGKTLGADFAAKVQAKVVSREPQVKQVWAKLRLGEANAGVVYRTDVVAGEGVTLVELPADCRVLARYPAVMLGDASEPELAQAWLDFLRAPAAQTALRNAGFLPPGR